MRDTDQMLEPGSECPQEGCDGRMDLGKVENCRCHICPPCGACVENPLVCDGCGYSVAAESQSEPTYTPPLFGLYKEREAYKSKHDFGNGKRVFDCEYDGRSGTTMVWKGRYEGEVTAADIIAFFGDGTFGHRGPCISNGRFTYTLITD